MANAIYTMVSETGRCFQLRADTEDTYKALLYLGKSTFNEAMVDVVDEIRSVTEDEDDFRTSAFLGLGEDHKEIPSLFKARELFLKEEAMLRLTERLLSGELVFKAPVEVELVEISEEVEVSEEVDVEVETMSQLVERLSSGEMGIVEPVEILEGLIKTPDEVIRPRVNIKTIRGKPETKDHSSLFDE